MLYLFFVNFGPIDFHEIMPVKSAIILILVSIVLEVVLGLTIRSILIKKKKEDCWFEKTNKEEEKEIPYVKKNFLLKWFLVGTENKVLTVTKVITAIKNIAFIAFITLCVLHMVVFKNFTYGFMDICLLVVSVLQIFATVPEYFRHKSRK